MTNIPISPEYLAQQAYHWACGSLTAPGRYASHVDITACADDALDPATDNAISQLFYRCVAGVDIEAPNARQLILRNAQALSR